MAFLGRYFKKYVWELVNKVKQITYFFYDNDKNDSRGNRPIQTFLGYFFGTIQSDGYVVYKELTKDNPVNERLMCRAHVRNKFEAAFRPFTVKRKNSLFFSSEDGIESALKCHTLIETCKNVGLNVKEYFTYVFSILIEGEKD